MKIGISSLLGIFFLCFEAFSCFSQPANSTREWVAASPFDQNVFIENKGQFDGKNSMSDRIDPERNVLYSCSVGDINIFFNAHGLTFRYDEAVYEEADKGSEEVDKRNSVAKPHFLHVEWLDASADGFMSGTDSVSWYYTYGRALDREGKSSTRARAFRKVVYRNIYPHIDIEYTIPEFLSEKKWGIKYSLILHPGADISKVQMKYSGAKNISVDGFGNILVKSDFGVFQDIAPIAFYSEQNNNIIPSSFVISGNQVSFTLSSYDHTKTVVVDPWTVNPPAFSGTRKAAYDVEYDLNGNVYAYGGTKPYQVIKYNSAGVQQWIYTTVFLTDYYGDFAVDGASGSAYIVEGYRQGAAQIIKINSAGTQLAVNPGTPNQDEYSRIVYNNCIKKAIVVGGGVSGNCQAGILDTTLTTYTPVNVLGAGTPLHDFALLAIDNTSQCFMATVRSFNHPGVFDNKLLRCPAATLTPTSYVVSDNHLFLENASVNYTNGPFQPNGTNGFNGIAVSGKYVYTYDGQVIQRRNKLTGAFVNSATVTATPFLCGGIAVTDCDDVFVGVEKTVIRFDTNFTVLSTLNLPDTVYDVRLAITNCICVCGKNFVSYSKILGPPLSTCNTLSVSISPGGSCGSGNALANVTGGSAPYTYSWIPGGQTTSSVTGLSPGTYTLFVSDNSCVPKACVDSITISASTFSTSATSTPASCGNNDGTAVVAVFIGTAPYTYAWSPSGGNTSMATALAPGTYSVVVTDASGCTSLNVVSVIIPNAPVVAVLPSVSVSCAGGSNGSVSVSANGGSGPYTYQWLPSGGSSSAATGLSAGVYSITVTDANNCSQTQTVSIQQPGAVTLSVSSTQPSCANNNGTASAFASGGTGSYTYSWSPSGQSTATATGLGSSSYTVIVSDANGCTASSSVLLSSPSAGTVSVTAQTNVSCNGGSNGSATVSISGGASPYVYSWSNGQTTAAASGFANGNYTVSVTDANGCVSTQTILITQPTAISVSVTTSPTQCNAFTGSATAIASGGAGPYSYSWNPYGGNSSTASGLGAASYSITITDANGCVHTVSVTVTSLNGPSANAGSDVTIITGDSVSLSGSGGSTFIWSPSVSLSCASCQNPVASPTSTTTYTVIVTDANGCTDADVIVVFVEPITCANKPNAGRFYLPSAFSPNGDGENDQLCLFGWDECIDEFSIFIYNRWGEKVFEAFDKAFCWDGTYNFKPVNSGIFVFYGHVVMYDTTIKNIRGNISVVR